MLLAAMLVGVVYKQGLGSDYIYSVFSDSKQRQSVYYFVDYVLRQIHSDQLDLIVKQIEQERPQNFSGRLSDRYMYEKLLLKLVKHKNFLFDKIRVLKLIQFQKKLLKSQIEQLLGDVKSVTNCLEIGRPGTYASTILDRIDGKIIAAIDKPEFSDVLQAHSYNPFRKFKGYHRLVRLNNYDPIRLPTCSVDLVICTIGLHHIPVEKLDAFIDSIYQILTPGGLFLLREHDAFSDELVSLASVAHSLFNAIIPGESLESELSEVRNFHALTYWKQLLEKHRFVVGSQELLQFGDSTLNTFIKCTKKL